MSKKDLGLLALIPAELALGTLASKFVSPGASAVIFTLLGLIVLITVMRAKRDVLAENWQRFKVKWFWRVLAAFVLAAGAHLVVSGSRSLLQLHGVTSGSGDGKVTTATLLIALIASLTTVFAPFVEEVLFRHVLFYQFKNRGAAVYWSMWIVQAVLFGLIHFFNFDGQIMLTVPYMFGGLYFALIYHFSKNIWQNIFTHLIFNSVSFIGSVFLLVMHLMGAY